MKNMPEYEHRNWCEKGYFNHRTNCRFLDLASKNRHKLHDEQVMGDLQEEYFLWQSE